MASKIVKALKNATSSLKSVDEPEIVAVVPPPGNPKRSGPPPASPAPPKQATPTVLQQQPSPPLSPVTQELENVSLTGQPQQQPEFTPLCELPDTSVSLSRSPELKPTPKKRIDGENHPPADSDGLTTVDGGNDDLHKVGTKTVILSLQGRRFIVLTQPFWA